jgi:catalase-peroxidase
VLEDIQARFNKANKKAGKQVSLADLIVLGGCAAVEAAAAKAGHKVKVPFTPGRTDATQEQTDADSFEAGAAGRWLPQLPEAEVHRLGRRDAGGPCAAADTDRAGNDGARRRPAGAGRQHGKSKHGVFTRNKETLTNDFFVNLLDMGTEWKPTQRSRRGRVRGH